MKKDSFIKGAVVATLGIVIVKLIGLLYVIPFKAIIGEQGGALYGYAYNIYSLFLAVSSAGFPFAISKLTSEYIALGYKKAVKDTYKIATSIISVISVVIFVLLFIFAPQIGKLIIGNSTGGNSYSDIAFVIRMVSFAILVVPFLSVTKGFLQGNKYISPTSISQIIEQVIRVIIILLGSFVALRIFKTDLKTAVGITMSGAFFGGLFAFIYLRIKIKKNNLLPHNTGKDEKVITRKEIISKILKYSIPFIIINLIFNLYNTVDMVLVSRTLRDILKYPVSDAETIVSIFTTWGVKLNNIIIAIITGLITSLIPNIVSAYTKGDKKDVDNKFNKALQCVLLIMVPCTLFMSFLSEPIWTLFYGDSYYGPICFKMFVFSALFSGLYSVVVNTLQGLSKYKLVITTVLIGLITNTILDVPFMLLADKWGFPVSDGAIVAAVTGYFLSSVIALIFLHKKYGFNFTDTRRRLPSFVITWLMFEVTIVLLKLVVPTNLDARLIQIPILCLFGVVSFGIYILANYKMGNLTNLFDLKRRKK